MFFSHDPVKIHPWGIYAFAPYILKGIQHIIKNLNAKMGHTDLIDIRETHGKPDVHRGRILLHHIHLAANITRRLGDLEKDFIT